MLTRRTVGVADISLWAGLIVFAILAGFDGIANGEQMFENLPEGWEIEESFTVPMDQTAAISLKLGGKISKLTNTVLSIKGQRLQVNVLHCPAEAEAEKIYKGVLKVHNGLAVAAVLDGKMVVEFAKCDDVNLMNQARLTLGFPDGRLDGIASKVIRKIPDGWQVEKSFMVPRDQIVAIEKKLGGRIRNLSNTIFSVNGKRFKVNVVECAAPPAAEKIYNSILAMKADPAFCKKYGDTVVEFVGDDVELAKRAVRELGIGDMPIETLAKNLVSALASGDFNKATENFDKIMEKGMPVEKLRIVWSSIIAQLGSFIEQAGVRREKIMQYDVIFVTCKFEKGFLDTKVVFDGNKRIAGLFFLPAKKPATEKSVDLVNSNVFSEKEVLVGTGQTALPGTLTLPKGQGPFPVVVLVHGSGPQDRDETLGPNKPFRDLAHGLARRGIAVLRYEKRTKAFPAQTAAIINTLTVKEEVIDDVLAAAVLLRENNQIDANKVFVLGHSLGGYVVPRIGKLDPKIAGFIIMAGTTRPLEDVVMEQFTYIASLDGVITDDEGASLEQLKSQIARVKDPKLSSTTAATDLPLGVPAAYWLDLRGYKPAEAAKELMCPMLILQGGRDYQVTDADFQLWKKALSSRKNVEFKFYEGLNHLFMEGQGKATPAEYERAGHVAETVIEDIASWIKKFR